MQTRISSLMKTTAAAALVLLLASCADSTDSTVQNPSPDNSAQASVRVDEIAVLRQKIDVLKTRAQQVKDSNDIKRLQRAYGYYIEKGLWNEVTDLFSDDATLEMARDGVYVGKPRIRDYFLTLGEGQQGLKQGQLNEQLQLMPVVTLGEDGSTAKARWRNIMLIGQLGEKALWGEGPFENEYVKENGVWKISKLRWQQAILVAYEGGWGRNEDYNKGIWVSDRLPPDAPPTEDHQWWPETWLLPFHFANPVATYVPPVQVAPQENRP